MKKLITLILSIVILSTAAFAVQSSAACNLYVTPEVCFTFNDNAESPLCPILENVGITFEDEEYTIAQITTGYDDENCQTINPGNIHPVPEFGLIGGSLALIGAAGAYLKRKKAMKA